MSKHAPLPWYMTGPNDTMIWSADGEQVARAIGDYKTEWERMEANADLIVRVVNSHADLLEALDNLLKVIDGEGGTKPNAREMARAAIAKATGETP